MANTTVVISGGGTGIGLACAARFSAQGAQVVLLGRRRERLQAARESLAARFAQAPEAIIEALDLAEPAAVEALRTRLEAQVSSVDVLVCAAGGNVALQAPAGHYDDRPGDAPGGRLDGIARRYRDNFASNLLSSVLLIEALAPRLTRPGGRLLLIGSIAAYRGSGEGSYGAMKAALHPLCYDLAARFGAQGVTVNLIAPGYIEATEFFADKLSDRKRAELIDQTLDQRPGTPDDIAAAVEWLAGQEASHITGQILQINGGAQLGC